MSRPSQLILFRHAKASEAIPDIDRPLSDRGQADAAAAGAWLAANGYWPELVLCSPARRARETWVAAALGAMSPEPTLRIVDELYSASTREQAAALDRLIGAARTVLIVAHNPGLSQWSNSLDPDATDPMRTAGIRVHEVSDWTTVDHAPLIAAHTARA